MLWKFKACPRCDGDIYYETDSMGFEYWSCLQCGWWSPYKKIISKRKEKELESEEIKKEQTIILH